MRGVSGRARYLTGAGRSATMSLRRLHRRVFLAGKPPTGMLHIPGRSDDLTFRLSKPRYNGSRQTVSYTAKPLPGTPLSRRGAPRAAAVQRRVADDPPAPGPGGRRQRRQRLPDGC